MRKLRHIPPGGALVEVTVRTQQGRFLLRPSQELNQIATGVLARALKQADVRFHGIVCLSNHLHLLTSVPDALQLAKFMGYFNGLFARLVARLHDWPDTVWSRRFQAIVISDETDAQEERLRYLLSHGAKEDLVPTPRDWPGLHLAKNIVDGEPLRGYWINRTQLNKARAAAKRSRETVDPMDFATFYEVPIEPLPHWRDRPFEEYRAHVAELVRQIEEKTLERRRKKQPVVLGRRKVQKTDPHHRPEHIESSPAPMFHTVKDKVFKALWDAYAWFVLAYRAAAEKLKNGDRDVEFPPGCFPPGLPFVPG